MNSKDGLHMNPGEGETSYARNSALQKGAQDRMKTLIVETVTDLLAARSTTAPKNMVIADLGCSSGPNALRLVSTAVHAIYRHCLQHTHQLPPDISVFLNDLPQNDFNTVAKSLATLKQTSQDFSHPLLVTGMIPGSFYERLFACGSLHFVLSSNSLHWLSKAPEDLKKSRIPMYDSDEHLRLSRRQIVTDAYARQFRQDFMRFLTLRAQELVHGGRMVISLYIRCSDKHNYEFTQPWMSAAIALSDMALRGLITREKLNSFYVPIYSPLDKEVIDIIEDEGSFQINKTLMHDTFGGMEKSLVNSKMMAFVLRAAFEPMLVQHFGSSKEIIDDFTRTLERQLISGGLNAMADAEYPLAFLCLSLTKAI